ncbi:unnamed protein product [Effrenium voratum]|nr:unnamed protein product [Effrenium voratum]
MKDLISVITNLGRLSRWPLALETFRQVPASKAGFAACGGTLCKAQQWALALEMLQESRRAKLVPSLVACNATTSAVGRGAWWQGSLDVAMGGVPELINRSVQAQLGDAMAFSLLGALGWRKALRQFEEMERRQIAPDSVAFETLATACQQGFAWQQAMAALQRQCDSAFPSVAAFTSTMSACAKASQWHKVLKLLHAMPEAALQPDRVAMDMAAFACVQLNDKAEALRLFREREALSG